MYKNFANRVAFALFRVSLSKDFGNQKCVFSVIEIVTYSSLNHELWSCKKALLNDAYWTPIDVLWKSLIHCVLVHTANMLCLERSNMCSHEELPLLALHNLAMIIWIIGFLWLFRSKKGVYSGWFRTDSYQNDHSINISLTILYSLVFISMQYNMIKFISRSSWPAIKELLHSFFRNPFTYTRFVVCC